MANQIPYWVVAVSIPLSRFDDHGGAFELGRELQTSVGECGGSGCGMGNRDLDWTFYNQEEAEAFEQKVLEFFSESIIPTGDDFSDGDPVQIAISEYARDEDDD
jgi:hypothetical protein